MVFNSRGINELRALIFHLIVLVPLVFFFFMMHDDEESRTFVMAGYRGRRAPLESIIHVMHVGLYGLQNTDPLKCSIQLGVSGFSGRGTPRRTVVLPKSTN